MSLLQDLGDFMREGRFRTWPNPEVSIGESRGVYQKTGVSYWEAKGPAFDAFEKLLPEIHRLLDEHRLIVSNSDVLLTRVYMVGESPAKALPHIMFAANSRHDRKRAMQIVKASKLLKRFPGMQVGHWKEIPHIGSQQLATDSSRQHFHAAVVSPKAIETIPGIEGAHAFQIRFDFDHGSTVSTVAAGCLLNDETYFLVAGHALFSPPPPRKTSNPESASSDSGNSEFDFGGLTSEANTGDDLDITREEPFSTSLGSRSDSAPESRGWWSRSHVPVFERRPSDTFEDEDQEEARPWAESVSDSPSGLAVEEPPTIFDITQNMVCFDMDYGITSSKLCKGPILEGLTILSEAAVREPPGRSSTQLPVMVCTAQQGTLKGTLCRDGTYARFRNSSSFQEVYHVVLESPILTGDSGSTVSDVATKEIYGHVISRSVSSTTGLVVPAKQVWDDLCRIPTHMDNERLANPPTRPLDVYRGPTVPSLIHLPGTFGPTPPPAGPDYLAHSDIQHMWDGIVGEWDSFNDGEASTRCSTQSRPASSAFGSPRSQATSIPREELGELIMPLDLNRKPPPIDIFRSHLAQILVRAVGCDLQSAHRAIKAPGVDRCLGDLLVIMPRLRPKNHTQDEYWEMACDIARKFPRQDPHFVLPLPNDVLLPCFYSKKACVSVLQFILEQRSAYGQDMCSSLRDGHNGDLGSRKVVVEFSSPNIGRPLNVNALHGAILGEYVAAVHESMGWDVVRWNYLGDWGMPVLMLGVGWARFGSDQLLEANPSGHLSDISSEMETLIRTERMMMRQSQKVESGMSKTAPHDISDDITRFAKRMQDGDLDSIGIARRFRDLSIDSFKRDYTRLDVHFDAYSGESQVSPQMMLEAETILRQKGACQERDGDLVMDPEIYDTGCGKGELKLRHGKGSSYLLREITFVLDRSQNDKFDKIVNVTPASHNQHHRRVSCTMECMGLTDVARSVHHVSFVPKKFSPSTSLSAHEVMNRFKTAAQTLVEQDEAASLDFAGLTTEGFDVLGMAALRVQILGISRRHTVTINTEDLGDFVGNTGFRLQRWYLRLCRTLHRVGVDDPRERRDCGFADLDWLEAHGPLMDSLRLLVHYPEVVKSSYLGMEPSQTLKYLFRLVDELETILDDDDDADHFDTGQASASDDAGRATLSLLLFESIRQVMENGMRILGIIPLGMGYVRT